MRALAAVAVIVCACSSSKFDVVAPGADDAAAETEPTIDSAATSDEGVLEGSVPDEGVVEVPAVDAFDPCTPLADASEVFVDAKSLAIKPNGAAACPFRTVADATDYVATLAVVRPRTIRVKTGIYTETRAVRVPPQTALNGAGAPATTISGGGLCRAGGTFKCIVRLDKAASIRDLQVTGASEPTAMAISAVGGTTIGPNMQVVFNKQGVVTYGEGDVKIAGTDNHFDDNTLVGILHAAIGRLVFEGGSANNNGVGLRLGEDTPGTPALSSITNLRARENNVGLRITGDASVRLRSSTFVANKFGVVANYGLFNTLDFGTGADGGGNTFGGATVGKNTVAGVCLQNARAKLPIVNNKWAGCPTTTGGYGGTQPCEEILTTYNDVWYRGAFAPEVSGCEVGP